jgi:hypothetical protein
MKSVEVYNSKSGQSLPSLRIVTNIYVCSSVDLFIILINLRDATHRMANLEEYVEDARQDLNSIIDSYLGLSYDFNWEKRKILSNFNVF